MTLLTWDDVNGIWYLKGPYAFALEQNEDVKWVYNKEKGKYALSVLVVCSFFQLCQFSTNIFTRALLVWMPLLLDLFLALFLISVRRSGCMDRKKNRNRTECNREQPDPQLRLPRLGARLVAGCLTFQILENRQKTGCNQLQPVF